QATYTADESRIDRTKNKISWQGAMAEMADSASNAVRYQAENKPELAKKEQDKVRELAAQASVAAPAPAARILQDRAKSYDDALSQSAAGVQSARKSVAAAAA